MASNVCPGDDFDGSDLVQQTSGVAATSILILSNLVPLAGILFWGWDAFVLLCLYWLENAVVGVWTLLRVVTMSRDRSAVAGRGIAGALAIGGFFIVHAGIFMTVHMVFLWTLFAGPWASRLHDARDFIRLIVIGQGLWLRCSRCLSAKAPCSSTMRSIGSSSQSHTGEHRCR